MAVLVEQQIPFGKDGQKSKDNRRSFDSLSFAQDDKARAVCSERQRRILRFAQDDKLPLCPG
jgi:hypothetical protein